MLKIENLSKIIAGKEILKNINIEIPDQTIVGFIGPNGAGKTTTFKMCSGLSSITSGNVYIDGVSIKEDFESYMNHIGVSLCNNNFYNGLSAFDNAKIFSALFSVSDNKIIDTLDMVGLGNRKDSLVSTYSLGMKQRLSIALSMLHNPSVILLDEPFNGIDPKGIFELRTIIKEISENNKTSFLISSHNLSEISKISSRNYYINGGVIVKSDIQPSNQSIIDVKVDNATVFQEILIDLKINFFREENIFFFSVDNTKINRLLNLIINRNITIHEFSTGTYLERKYIEMMGENNIE